jgi:hypothetical protein
MSFPELDEALRRQPTQKPPWWQRWLRAIFVEDLGLKLLALVISLALWYGVTGQRTPTTVRMQGVRLNFRLPPSMEISNEPRTEVEVTLTGNKPALERINARDLIAYVDVSDYKPGERSVQLTQERVTMGLPEGVRIDDIEPNTVPLRLEPRVESELEVEVRYSGQLPEGYELRSVNAVPAKVRVRGPASHVNALQKVPTEIIALDGRKESFTLSQIAADIPDKKVDIVDAVIDVNVEIGEQRIEKSFAGVRVVASDNSQVRPETASLTLYGPRSIVGSLRPEDMRIILDVAPDGSSKPRLELPPNVQGVELRSTNPSGFTIKRLLF